MNQYDSDKTIINIRYSFSSLSNFFLFSEQANGFKRKHSLTGHEASKATVKPALAITSIKQ